ncbi:MAG: hypothetical protein J7K73_01090 [Nanoarchaeota archaeon]|nr:hypothetical protein [Nanoarchaeota archaeon]
MFVLAIIVGVAAMFFLSGFPLFGPLLAGFISGLIAKGPIAGLLAGFFVALAGFFLTTTSSITAFAVLGSMNLTNISSVEPVSLIKTVFGITGVAVATAGGFIGGLLRR